MSKKKKDSHGKKEKKKSEKKHLKKVEKSHAKKSAPKKPASKLLKTIKISKKVVKKEVKKVVKAAPKKPLPAKKAITKASKPKVAKHGAKPLPKKAIKSLFVKKPASKPTKPSPVAKKPSPVTKKPAPVTKKPEPKKVELKPIKHKEIPAPKPTPATAKKEIKKEVAPVNSEKVKKADEPPTKKQIAELRSQDVLAISNTIPVKQKNDISASKIASISRSITNPIKRTDSYAIKPEKEPAGKFELEFVVHSSAEMLYEFLSTPSGLSEWFCDDLNIRNGIYTFIWDDQLMQARLLKTVELQLVRFQWVDKTDGSYFEFRIQRDDLTNDISLIITDFAESVGDRESSKLLWHSQVEKLMHVLGSIF